MHIFAIHSQRKQHHHKLRHLIMLLIQHIQFQPNVCHDTEQTRDRRALKTAATAAAATQSKRGDGKKNPKEFENEAGALVELPLL